jgi:hypothetical protein
MHQIFKSQEIIIDSQNKNNPSSKSSLPDVVTFPASIRSLKLNKPSKQFLPNSKMKRLPESQDKTQAIKAGMKTNRSESLSLVNLRD